MLASLRSSRLFAAVAILAWAGSVQANGITVRITEAMSSSGTGGTNDWFEITNYGSTAVDITGWRMDDSPFVFASSVPLTPYTTGLDPAWTVLEPGESAVMLESATAATAVPAFQLFWNLGPASGNVRNPKFATYTGSGVSFSSGSDGVVVFDATGAEGSNRVSFGAATGGSSFYWSYDSAGVLDTAEAGTVSSPNVAFAYATSTSPSNIGSPGIAVIATEPATTLYWTADGVALGGSGSWTAAGTTWSAAESPITPGTWAEGATAIFGGVAGTVAVNGDVAPLGLTFTADGYSLAAGTGSIATPSVSVTTGQTATVAARFTGDTGITLLGGGTLVVLGTSSDYTGATSVAAGTLRAGASEVIPDASRLTVARLTTADLSGYTETTAGVAGAGTITLGDSLTVNLTGTADAVFDGFLRGTGNFIVDSAGTGVQRLDASTSTILDSAVKDYTGSTIVRRGTLRVDFNGIPTHTSSVDVEAGATLRLGEDNEGFVFTFGGQAATAVNLKGGTLGQAAGDDVTLNNALNVTADSTFSILNSATPDPANPNTEEMILSGTLTGTAGRTITITASNTTPGADKGRVTFASPSGNTFTGTVGPQVNATARFTGDYAGVAVALDQGRLDGSGTVGAVSGTGTISPEGDLGPGILTATSITTSATTAFEFDFNTKNAEPVWFSPTASENDVLRLTGATPLPNALGSGNAVRLFLNVGQLTSTDTFTGGFFTTADPSAAVSGGGYETYIYGDGFGTAYTYNGVGWYSLASYNAQQSSTLSTSISMVSASATFDGVTPTAGYVMRASYAPSADIVIDVPSGSLTQAQAGYAAIAVADSVTKTGAGTVVFDAVNGYSGPTRIDTGRLTLAAAGTVAASPLVAVAAGATFDVSAKTGGYAVPAGQTLAGSGTVEGSVAIGTGATLSPGASPGTLTVTGNVTFGAGGNYNWQALDFGGTAGSASGWDLLSVGGTLDVAATSGSPYAINLWSLSGVAPDVNGSAVNWNSAQNGSWKIASAVGGITGFAADKFAVNTAATNGTAGFTNDPAGGSFAVVQDGNDLVLQFTAGGGPAPEPVRITGVYVKGSGWNADYQARSPFSNVQGATVGWELPDGSAQLANASNVAWNNVNTITVEFDQPITQPDAAALQLVRGTASGNQTIVPSLDPTLLGDGSVAQWTLPAGFAALERGKYVISIAADGITNIAGTTILDGDWITGVSTFAQGSGDGEAGGSFNFFFNALVGDVNGDGVMNAGDLSGIRSALTSPLNTLLAADSSNYRLDIDGLNSLNSADLSKTRAQLTSALGTQLSSLPAVTAPAEGMAASGLTVTAVPEPGSLGLLACGLAALLALGVRRQKA